MNLKLEHRITAYRIEKPRHYGRGSILGYELTRHIANQLDESVSTTAIRATDSSITLDNLELGKVHLWSELTALVTIVFGGNCLL